MSFLIFKNTGVSYLKTDTNRKTYRILKAIGIAEINAITKISLV